MVKPTYIHVGISGSNVKRLNEVTRRVSKSAGEVIDALLTAHLNNYERKMLSEWAKKR